jgi:hypothetical protein
MSSLYFGEIRLEPLTLSQQHPAWLSFYQRASYLREPEGKLKKLAGFAESLHDASPYALPVAPRS